MIAAVFPGQGSQHIGMGKFLYDNFSSARLMFEEASDCLGISFAKLCFDSTEADLALTYNTQPALLIVSSLSYRILQEEFSLPIAAMAGHSIGEYSALYSGSVFSFVDALKAVRLRGRLMQDAVPVGQGGMVAILGMSDSLVEDLCRWVTKESKAGILEPANFNAPGQVVASGSLSAIDWLKQNIQRFMEQHGAKAKLIPLNVSAPFHCSMMKIAEAGMQEFLLSVDFQMAKAPVVQNYSAKSSVDPSILRENLIKQVTGPVRWTQCVSELKSLGIKVLIECGPGKVLAGLGKKIDSEGLSTFNINNLEDLKSIGSTLKSL